MKFVRLDSGHYSRRMQVCVVPELSVSFVLVSVPIYCHL